MGPERHLSHFYLNKPSINKDVAELASDEKKIILEKFLTTIRFMDHRRLKRQLQGVRKPLPYYRVMIFTLFCLFLIIYPYIFIGTIDDGISVGLKFPLDPGDVVLTIFLAILILFGIITVARLQSALSLQWAMYTVYIFIMMTFFILMFSGFNYNVIGGIPISILLLYTFGLTQLCVHIAVRLVISLGPKLALRGYWFSWAENFKVIEKRKDSITFSRYNDITGLFGNNIFCICLCCYKISYRAIRKIINKFLRSSRKKHKSKGRVQPPFSHQIRYKGSFDEAGRPHGYGEWLEDHPYGERLQGFWWHGFPFASYESQEVGSGSTFNSTVVGFFASNKKFEVSRGVAACEISISGHFFTDFPNTIYVNPVNIDMSIPNKIQLYNTLVIRKHENVTSVDDISWCFAMLNWHASNPFSNAFDDSSVRVYLDRNSGLLSINGYRHSGHSNLVKKVTVSVEKRNKDKSKTAKKKVKPYMMTETEIPKIFIKELEHPSAINSTENDEFPPLESFHGDDHHTPQDDKLVTPQANPHTEALEPPLPPEQTVLEFTSHNEHKETKSNFSLLSLRTLSIRHTGPSNERFKSSNTSRVIAKDSFVSNILNNTKRKLEEALEDEAEDEQQPVSSLFQEQDEWTTQKDKYIKRSARISVENWRKIHAPIGITPPEEIFLFIPGYNVDVSQGCAQLSHLVSFSKLPGYIHPVMFHWGGAMHGIFSPLLYPLCKKRAMTTSIGENFVQFMRELKEKNVKRIHLLSHSAGVRVFMNGMRHCRGKGIFMENVLNNPLEKPSNSISSSTMEQTEGMVVKSIILINPDYPLQTFLEDDFFFLRDISNNFTLYGDTRDQILFFSEFWNRERCVGKRIFELYLSNDQFEHAPVQLPDQQLKSQYSNSQLDLIRNRSYIFHEHNPDFPLIGEDSKEQASHMISTSTESPDFLLPYSHTNFDSLPMNLGSSTHLDITNKGTSGYQSQRKLVLPDSSNPIYINPITGGTPTTFPFISREVSKPVQSQEEWLAPKAQAVKWLNLDVIDTTFVETHTDFLKHTFYQVSREIVDDIREVITTGSRAHERVARLDKRRGNVYCFRVAPANVKSIYG